MPEVQAFLQGATERAVSDPIQITVRQLLDLWGYQKRGYKIVALIERDLAKYSLTTSPPFQTSWIDNKVTITRRESNAGSESTTVSAPTTEVGLTVASLRSSSSGITSVTPQTPLRRTVSVMLRYDYSQLPVMVGTREVKGAVTWESIVQSGSIDLATETRAFMISDPQVVRAEDDLLPLVHSIATKGFVLVKQSNNEISGLITAADISEEFLNRTSPFFLLGEVEARIRRILQSKINTVEMTELLDRDPSRPVSDVSDLSFGEYVRLFQRPDVWSRFQWSADHREFTGALDDVREVRNDVMHFSPDQVEEERLAAVRSFLIWLKGLERQA